MTLQQADTLAMGHLSRRVTSSKKRRVLRLLTLEVTLTVLNLGGLKGRYGVPTSTFEGDYGEVTILQTKTGHKLEFDDTEGGERIQIHHANGAHIEMLPDGSINIVTEGRVLTRGTHRQEFISDSKLEVIGGDRTQTVEGDKSSSVLGSESKTVTGSSTFSANNLSASLSGDVTAQVGTAAETSNLFEVLSKGDISLNAFGDLDLITAGKGYLVAQTR